MNDAYQLLLTIVVIIIILELGILKSGGYSTRSTSTWRGF